MVKNRGKAVKGRGKAVKRSLSCCKHDGDVNEERNESNGFETCFNWSPSMLSRSEREMNRAGGGGSGGAGAAGTLLTKLVGVLPAVE